MASTSLLLLGFMLGMRHAIDPDHVVAVTAIVSREGSIRRAQWIGALWGIGHSATVFLVGGTIAVFKLAVPPALFAGRYRDARQHLRVASGVASVAFGLFLAYRTGFTGALFHSASGWISS